MDVISASGTQRLSDPTQQNAVYIVNDDGDMKKDAAYIDNDSNSNVDGDLRLFREKTISKRCYYAILAGFVVLMMVTAIIVTFIVTKASDNASRGIDAAPSEMSAMPSFAEASLTTSLSAPPLSNMANSFGYGYDKVYSPKWVEVTPDDELRNIELVHSNKRCYTIGGGSLNIPCVSEPWRFEDEPTVYNGCANPEGTSGGAWCPTELTNGKFIPDASGKWGFCNMDSAFCKSWDAEEWGANPCKTTGGGQPNTPCVSEPWSYEDRPTVYNGCANPLGTSGGDWCPTKLTNGKYSPGYGKWGYCNMKEDFCKTWEVEEEEGEAKIPLADVPVAKEGCSTTFNNGMKCVFPFDYDGKRYLGCVPGVWGSSWCSLTDDYESDKKWAYCSDNC